MTTQKVYGYIRVSTKEQNEDRQYIAMLEFGVKNRDIYMDKQSGKDFNRPAYKRVLRLLKPGDVLVVKSIDRLGRNYEEIIEQWRMITKIIGAAMWCWICRCWIHVRRIRTLRAPLFLTLYCRY